MVFNCFKFCVNFKFSSLKSANSISSKLSINKQINNYSFILDEFDDLDEELQKNHLTSTINEFYKWKSAKNSENVKTNSRFIHNYKITKYPIWLVDRSIII